MALPRSLPTRLNAAMRAMDLPSGTQVARMNLTEELIMRDDEHKKSGELSLWNAMLNDNRATHLRPEHQNGALRAHAAEELLPGLDEDV